jgi:outer membrane protein
MNPIVHSSISILALSGALLAQGDLQAKYLPRRNAIEKLQTDIGTLQETLRKGSATMSEDVKAKLMRDFDNGNKNMQRDTQDAQDELDQEQGKLMQELGNKMMGVIEKYSNQNGIALVVDVSNPQTPVLWASTTIDITGDIQKLYDQAYPSAGAPAGTAAPKMATPPTGAAPKPIVPPQATPPATKKK